MGRLYRNGGKRLFDLALAAGGLALFSLPMIWIAWRIRRESGRPVLFFQNRVGREGKDFQIFKFRTMTTDERITPFGRWLRATAMDELPQLFHIFSGQMSFVGPRPLIPEELKELGQIPGSSLRFSAQPGLTGLAQLFSSKVPSLPERLKWDLLYIRQLSLRLDLRILAVSIWVTARGLWEQPGAKAPCTLEGARF